MSQWQKGAAPLAAACMLVWACTPVYEGLGDYPEDGSTDTDAESDDDVAEDSGADSDDGLTGTGGGEGTNADDSDDGSTGDDSADETDGGTDSEDDSDSEGDSSDGGTGEGDSGNGDSGSGGGDSGEDDSGDDDDDEDDDSDGEDSGGGTGDDGGEECPATHRCIDSAPGGWFGPIALYQGDLEVAAPACVGGYTEAAFASFAGLNPGEASCTCRCGEADVECELASANFRPLNSECTGSPSPVHTINTLGCYSLDATYETGRWRTRNGSDTLAGGGSCPARMEESLPEPSWSTKIKGCSGAELIDGCSADQVCAPIPTAPFEQRHCIYRAGDAECPDGIYGRRLEGFEGYTDSRECKGSCGCAEPDGHCETTIELFNGDCESTPLAEIPVPGDCIAGAGAIDHGQLKFTPIATCEPTGAAEVAGEVVPDGVITVCCTQ